MSRKGTVGRVRDVIGARFDAAVIRATRGALPEPEQAGARDSGALRELEERLAHIERAHAATSTTAVEAAYAVLGTVRRDFTRLQREVLDGGGAGQGSGALERRVHALERRTGLLGADAVDALYGAFEETFRGSEALIEARLQPYLQDVRDTKPDGPFVDLGCGRGEWLRLLRAAGFDAYGVETSASALDAAINSGLDVRSDDAVEHLEGADARSLAGVSAFHVVEHLPFDQVLALVSAARRALAPGGLLIVETPDVRNLRVGATTFWLDPTHVRPVHPELFAYVLHQEGFDGIEVRSLQPWSDEIGSDSETVDTAPPLLRDLLLGGQDVGIVARCP